MWGYADSKCPPEQWHESFPAGAGSAQSPIDISNAQYSSVLRPITIEYDDSSAANIVNTGHSVQVNFNPGSTINGAHLNDTYELIQFHFHWGGTCGNGAEHLINGASADGELHFVHKRHNCQSPTDVNNGLAVLGVRLIVDDEKANGVMDVTRLFEKCHNVGEQNPINEPLQFDKMIPDLAQFYTYQGSLTTPPLAECVCWIVAHTPLYITTDEMARFRALTNAQGVTLSDNFRPVMPLNTRTLNASFNNKTY